MQFDVVEILKFVASILSGIAVCIPLVQKLCIVVRDNVRAKNWAPIMKMIIDLMEEAEPLFADGELRKIYVMNAIRKSAVYVEYDIDMEVVSQMIDDLCAMSKVVNPPAEPEKAEAQ